MFVVRVRIELESYFLFAIEEIFDQFMLSNNRANFKKN